MKPEDWVLSASIAVACVVSFVAIAIGTQAMEEYDAGSLALAHHLLAGAAFAVCAASSWHYSRPGSGVGRRLPIACGVLGLLVIVLGLSAPQVLGVVFQVVVEFS